MISADEAQKGELVTLDFEDGGLGLAYELNGKLYTTPGTGNVAYQLPIPEEKYEVKRDGGDSYQDAFNYEMNQESN